MNNDSVIIPADLIHSNFMKQPEAIKKSTSVRGFFVVILRKGYKKGPINFVGRKRLPVFSSKKLGPMATIFNFSSLTNFSNSKRNC